MAFTDDAFNIGDRVKTPFSDRIYTIIDIKHHYHRMQGVEEETDYLTDDGEWHYDGWYFKKIENNE